MDQKSTPSFHYPHPEKFQGKRDGFSALTWLRSVRRYFLATSTPENIKTVVAASLLGEEAGQWFDGSSLPDDTSFPEFERRFKLAYIPSDFDSVLRSRLATLRMSTTVDAHVAEARRLLTALLADASSDLTRIELQKLAHVSFLEGCPKSLQQLLRALMVSQTLSVYQLFEAAEQYDRVYNFTPDGKNSGLLGFRSTQA
ncbi:hypothetical protein BGW38_009645 [Lunasporangiospora selenospora]|uniref:Retrotransposon gag domain-containing protein n=1 Tax=Lunasporangiospora selenospora TaxID=979761 RepID=A0A9P6FCN5_9FUNG|nr:hypothetical protein BGW38_009645 [Lunasporangiospora selenospora]